jgi:putative radical SAM enzyme (TIGR03279 family)
MKITAVEPNSIAEELGLRPGDELLEINGKRVADAIDYRFYESDPDISVKVARNGEITIYDIEKDEGERLGLDFEDFKILACGNDCIFCFVDQNPRGLRNQLYFRDGDYRLSFMYGNYTTMTNAGPAILRRIIQQRLSPQYISVHVTDYTIRKLMMGLKKDDLILEKLKLLHDHEIDMHTQIVLCPGLNDGVVLEKTVHDLYQFNKHIISLAIVPVGLTDHRFGLHALKTVDANYANALLDVVESWQAAFKNDIGRSFVYCSDEIHIVAGREIPGEAYYDGFPQTENGVGLVRKFIMEFEKQSRHFPKRLSNKRKLTLATAELPHAFLQHSIAPPLRRIGNLDVAIEVVPNVLFGRSVTVAGLLSGKCLVSSLKGKELGDLLLLPPDIVNNDDLLLDDMTIPQLENVLDVPVMVFDDNWGDVFRRLTKGTLRAELVTA